MGITIYIPKIDGNKSVSEVMGITLYTPKFNGCIKGIIDDLGLRSVNFI